jgi:hypothetical protein
MQAVDSAMFFDVAHTGYTQSGRGAIITVFPNINALESGEKAASFFMPRSELVKFEYADVVSFVDMYDPQQWYVTLAVVTVRQKGNEDDNSILLCKLVHKDLRTTTPPNCDQHGVQLRSNRVLESKVESAHLLCLLKCARQGCNGIRAKNSYSIERRLMGYVSTAFYGAVVVVSPAARAASSSSLS